MVTLRITDTIDNVKAKIQDRRAFHLTSSASSLLASSLRTGELFLITTFRRRALCTWVFFMYVANELEIDAGCSALSSRTVELIVGHALIDLYHTIIRVVMMSVQ